jgi:hypothetical protein
MIFNTKALQTSLVIAGATVFIAGAAFIARACTQKTHHKYIP